jgi:glycosyltransferase involved in cell wall biosynthesis
MADSPLFTVGVPTFNRAQMLRRTLKAVLDQSCADFEVLVADNASDDATPEVAAAFADDPRVRWHRQPNNLGPAPNFKWLVDHARGRYFVLHQDDDFLHRDFLARGRAVVDTHPGVTLYGAALWRGHPDHGFEVQLMPDPGGANTRMVTHDEPAVVDGGHAAVSFLYAHTIFHPALAMQTRALREAGGYCDDETFNSDALTQARVLLRGELALDARPGGILSVHGENYYRAKFTGVQRRARNRKTYAALLDDFDAAGVPWADLLGGDLRRMGEPHLAQTMNQWARCDAPGRLQAQGWSCLRQLTGKRGGALIRHAAGRMGWRKTLRSRRLTRRAEP